IGGGFCADSTDGGSAVRHQRHGRPNLHNRFPVVSRSNRGSLFRTRAKGDHSRPNGRLAVRIGLPIALRSIESETLASQLSLTRKAESDLPGERTWRLCFKT